MIFGASTTGSANGWVSTSAFRSMGPTQGRTRSNSPSTGPAGRPAGWTASAGLLCRGGGRPHVVDELQRGRVVQRAHGLVDPLVTDVRDPPCAVLTALVGVLVERRALDQDPEVHGNHGVLERPSARGRVAVYVDLRLAAPAHGDDRRPEVVTQVGDDLVPPTQAQRLAHGMGAVIGAR